MESTCSGLAANTSCSLHATEGQGQVITDMNLIGGIDPKAPVCSTTSGFSDSLISLGLAELLMNWAHPFWPFHLSCQGIFQTMTRVHTTLEAKVSYSVSQEQFLQELNNHLKCIWNLEEEEVPGFNDTI